jgi:hypothetical protein
MCIATMGISKVTGDSVYPFVIGFATCIAFLVQAIRSLQKQIDQLKSTNPPEPSDQTTN